MNNTPTAAISTAAAITSRPPHDADANGTPETYWLGSKILLRVDFNRGVRVTTTNGTPRLKIDLGPTVGGSPTDEHGSTERWAEYESAIGSYRLTFAYTVAEGDRSTAGISVPKNSLDLNGGVIADHQNGVEAALRFAALGANTGHRVDARVSDVATVGEAQAGAPTLQSVLVKGDRVALIYDEELSDDTRIAAGDFRVEVVGGGARRVTAVRMHGRGVVLTLAQSVADGQVGLLRVSYAKGPQFRIRDADGNEAAEFSSQRAVLDGTKPTFQAATVQGDKLTLTYNELLYPGPDERVSGQDFTVVVLPPGLPPGTLERDYERRVTAVAVSGQRVVLTLESAVVSSDVVQLRYVVEGFLRGWIRDFVGNRAGTLRRHVDHGAPPALSTLQPPSGGSPPTGGGSPVGDGGGGPAPSAGAPVANAGADLAVDPGASVTLDGSRSSDPDGDALTYAWAPVSGPTVVLSGAAAARARFRAPEEPGDLVFRLTVTDPGGLTGSDEATVTVRDLAPSFGAARVTALTLVQGEAMAPVVLPAATGGNGALTYSLSSAPAGLAGLSLNATTRTLSGTPAAEGSWTFTWRADDADANRAATDAAVLTFRVMVEDPRTVAVKRSVRRTLAEVARRAVTSALDNIGSRFAASVPTSGLTLAGETVPLGFSGARAGPGFTGAVPACTGAVSGHHGLGDASSPSVGPLGFGTGGDGDGCAPAPRSLHVGPDELLTASAFSLTLGAAEGSGLPTALLWSVWGRGDLGSFAGRPEPGIRYEGELRTGWLGADARAGPWVAGLAVSHGTGEADYSFDLGRESGEGRLETELTAFYPYGRWTVSDRLELRGVLGTGRGEVVHHLDGDDEETGDLSMQMASVGLRHEFVRLAKVDLAARADASVARLETEAGPDYVDGLTADSWRVRLGLEASRRFKLSGRTALVPFVEAAGRRDGGDGLVGTGVEVAGGLRYTAPWLHLEARGRWLAAHTEEGAEERGVSVTARAGPGAHGRGLSLMLNPRWGAGTGSAQALWRDELPTAVETSQDGAAAAMDAEIGYGVGLAPYGLLTPFAETGLSGVGDGRRLRLGTRFKASRVPLDLEFAGEHRDGGAAEPEQVLGLDARLRF